jgi:hypothetical protein
MAKTQCNYRLDSATAKWIADEARRQSKRTGKRVSQADVVTMLVAGTAFEPEPIRIPEAKPSKTANSREAWDLAAAREKPPIERGTVTHLDAVSENRGKATVQTFRRGPRAKGDRTR